MHETDQGLGQWKTEEFQRERETEKGMRDEEEYMNRIDEIWKEYEPKFKKLLQEVAQAAEAVGWETGDYWESSDEEYSLTWPMVTPDGKACDVQMILLEATCREGGGQGIAFGLDLNAECGHQIGGMTPYNYTADLWIDPWDDMAIIKRWWCFSYLGLPGDVLSVLSGHLERCEDW